MTRSGAQADARGFVGAWIDLVCRRWKTGAALFFLTMGSVATVLLLSRPVHRAETRLRLGEPPPMGGVSPNASPFGLFNLGGDPFANDLELMESRTLAEGVVEDVALNVRVDAPPEWYRDSLFHRVSAGRETEESTWELEWTGSGEVSARMLAPAKDSLRVSGAVGRPLSFAGTTLVPRPWREGMPRRVSISVLGFDQAVEATSSAIEPVRTRREANVVEIAFERPDPGLALETVRSVSRRFVELRSALHRRESRETMDSIRTVARETAAQLRDAEEAMERFQRGSGLVSPEAQGEASVERYSGSIQELERARLELDAVEDVLARVEAAQEPGRAWTTLVAFPRFLENETASQILQRLTALEEERTEIASRRSPENREYQVLERQISALDGTLRSLAEDYRTALVEQIVGLERQVARMDSVLAAIPGDAIELGRHQREIRILSEVLVLTEQRIRQEELRQALTFANVQVIDPPALLPEPVWPPTMLGAAVGLLLATGFGVVGMVVRERADRRVRSGRALREITGAPVVATPLRRKGGKVELDPDERRALRGLARGRDASGLVLAGLPGDGGEGADLLARALEEEGGGEDAQGRDPSAPGVTVVGELGSFARAAAALRAGAVVLVATLGHSREDRAASAVARIREAGGEVAGTVILCRSEREVREVWS